MNQVLAIAAAAIILITGALMQGGWTDRWVYEPPEVVDEWVQRLDDIPLTIGDWSGEVGESDERQLQVAKAAGGTSLTFNNARTGKSVSVFIVCGRGRYVANHTPDKCYVAAGYNMGQTPRPYEVVVDEYEKSGKLSPEFYTARFSKEATDHSEHLRIFWAWNEGGSWQAADPTAPVMYKMYVISQMRDAGEMIEESEARQFVKEVLPSLDDALFPAELADSATPSSSNEKSDDDTKANG